MCEGTPINVHLKEMKMLADKLALIGSLVSEEDQVVTLLGSLPTSFATIVTALEERGDGLSILPVIKCSINLRKCILEMEVEAVGVGDIRLKIVFKVSHSKPATVYDVLYVPKLACNLFSVQAATKEEIKSSLVRRDAGFEPQWATSWNGDIS